MSESGTMVLGPGSHNLDLRGDYVTHTINMYVGGIGFPKSDGELSYGHLVNYEYTLKRGTSKSESTSFGVKKLVRKRDMFLQAYGIDAGNKIYEAMLDTIRMGSYEKREFEVTV